MRLHNTWNTRRAAALLGAGLSLALPASASAIDPGVHYDPGSPAGKEYAIPLVEGRSEGAGTINQRVGANIPFGVGITPPGGGSNPGGGAGGGKLGSGGEGSGRKGSGASGEASGAGASGGASGARVGGSAGIPRDRSKLEARLADAESAGGTAGRTIGTAAAVLVAAALLGVALRRRQGPQAA